MSGLSPDDVNVGVSSEMSEQSHNMVTQPDNADKTTDQSEVSMDKVTDNLYIANMKTGGARLAIRKNEPFAPRPFKTIRNVIIVSYICYLFLIFPGAIAIFYAWEALKFRDLGAWSEAKAMVRSAVRWIYFGFVLGAFLILGAAIALGVEFG